MLYIDYYTQTYHLVRNSVMILTGKKGSGRNSVTPNSIHINVLNPFA